MNYGTRLKIAGKELIKGNIGNALKAVAAPAPFLMDTAAYRGLPSSGSAGTFFWDATTGGEVWFTYNSIQSALAAYTKCPPLTAVINKKAQAHLAGRQSVINTSGKGKGRDATGEMALRLKALLKRPNKVQTWNEFEAQVKIYQQVFGYCILLPIVPVGFPTIYATAIWVIPPFLCDIVEKPSLLFAEGNTLIQSITLTYKQEIVPLDPESVFIIKDITPSFRSLVLPESRICALAQPINNIIGTYNALGSLIDDRGALGMISSDKSDESGNVSLKPNEKEEIQDEFRKYGIRKGQFKYILTTAALKWTSIGFATKDLMLFEGIEDAFMRICDGYGVNSRLMSTSRNNSLGGNDAEIFEKQFYQNTIVPESDSLYDQLNNMLGTELYNIRLNNDFSHLAVLQADAVKTAQAGYLLSRGLQMDFLCNVITLNEWRVAKGWEPEAPELGDKRYSDIKDLIGAPAVHAGQMNEADAGTAGKLIQQLELL